jgi:hypothetical protein
MSKTQNLKNHARFDPSFHLAGGFILLANLVIVIIHLVRHPSYWNGWLVALSVLIIFPFLRIRMYPLKVQDRVIRLEERLRLQSLAPAEWHTQIARLTEDQLIGLRFAADDEVVALAKLALEEKLTRKQIKERVRSWRPDDWRI